MARVVRNERIRRWSLLVWQCLVVAAAYFGSARLGLLNQLSIEGVTVTPFWPATGVSTSALLLLGLRVWPGIAVGAIGVVLSLGGLRPTSLLVIAGNVLSPLCAWLLLRRAGFRVTLDRLRDGIALVFLGALVGMLISATAGSCASLIEGTLPGKAFWAVWLAWWAGDTMGVLVVAPVLLLLFRGSLPELGRGQLVEGVALTISVLVVTPLVVHTSIPLFFVVFPLLIWAALRFQLLGAAPAALVAAVLTSISASDATGPFAGNTVVERMVTVQAFNGSAALTVLLLSALTTEQLNVRVRIEQVSLELAEVVDHLTPGAPEGGWPRGGSGLRGRGPDSG